MDFNALVFPDKVTSQPVIIHQETQQLRLYGETPWHRGWKMAFPPSFREVCFWDEVTEQQHRADV